MPALEMYYKFQAEVQGAPLAIKYGGVAQSVERRISNERDLEKSQTATLTICIGSRVAQVRVLPATQLLT